MKSSVKTLAATLLASLAVGANAFELMPAADSSLHTEGIGAVTNALTFLMGGTMRREFISIPSTAAEIEALPESGNVPTIVLSSTRPSTGETPAFRTLAAQLQDEIATAYVARRHDFVPDSGHYIQRDQPQAVINAARELARCDSKGVSFAINRQVTAEPQ